jgi:hypothetical protein
MKLQDESSRSLRKEVAELQGQVEKWQGNGLGASTLAVQSIKASSEPAWTSAIETDLVTLHTSIKRIAMELDGLMSMRERQENMYVCLDEVVGTLAGLHKKTDQFDGRVKQVECLGFKGADVGAPDTGSLHQRVDQLAVDLENEVVRRCRSTADAESRWRFEMMELRTDVERERVDVLGAISDAMGPIPILITIDEASLMRSGQKLGSVDPYCVCEVSNKTRFQTKHINGSEKPIWRESFQVNEYAYCDQLLFSVFDARAGLEHHIGSAVLLGCEVYSNGFEGEIKLSDSGNTVNAFLRVKIAKMGNISLPKQAAKSTPTG